MDVNSWQDEESLRLKIALDACTNAVSFDDIRVSRTMAACYKAMQKAKRGIDGFARRS